MVLQSVFSEMLLSLNNTMFKKKGVVILYFGLFLNDLYNLLHSTTMYYIIP